MSLEDALVDSLVLLASVDMGCVVATSELCSVLLDSSSPWVVEETSLVRVVFELLI
jgi:hypothetical protein